MKNIHFIGINGSGISGIACIAKNFGFNVDGCDLVEIGDYTEQLNNYNIKIFKGHNVEHIKNADLVVVSPALLYKDKYKNIEETNIAYKERKLMKWQKFVGEYIMKKQNIIAVSGTHGKTTTTALISLLLENGNIDPTCIVGGIVKEWKKTYRCGKSNYFVCEADEYDGNFLNYYPKYAIINNIEMDHPELFNNFNEYLNNFEKFIKTIQENGKIFFFLEEKNVLNLLLKSKDYLKSKNIELIAISFENVLDKIENIKIINVKKDDNKILINNNYFEYKLIGNHNIKNISISIALSMELNIPINNIKEIVKNFSGAGRRLDLVYSNSKIKLYDDYAHHHTQINSVLTALNENKKENEKIIAILEPHLISRIKNNTKKFVNGLLKSDFPIITKIYKSREEYLPDEDVIKMINNNKIQYIEKQEDVINKVLSIINNNKNNNYTIIVMGAGLSYKITEKLKNIFENKN